MVKNVFRISLVISITIFLFGAGVLPILSSGFKNMSLDELGNCENCNYYQIKYGDNTESNECNVSNIYINNINNDDYLDQYNHEDDWAGLCIYYDGIDSYSWVAQSFIPIHPVLTRVRLMLHRWFEPWCDLVMSIRDDLNETDLVTSSKNYAEIPEDPGFWVEFDFPDISVDVGEEYYIVCTSSCGMFQGEMYLWMIGENTSYDRGDAWWITNYTDEWGTNYFMDCCFETYGYGGNLPPVANFTWTPTDPVMNETIFFDASSSHDPDGTIVLYEWDWDNDSNFDESFDTPTANHTWPEFESIPITLRVTDNGTANTTITKTIYGYNPSVIIDNVTGGFGVKTVIKNIGDGDAASIPWSIDIYGAWLTLRGGHAEGIIDVLGTGESETIRHRSMFAIGKDVLITVSAGSDTKQATASWVIGPLVLEVT
jgi:hypothetical protein